LETLAHAADPLVRFEAQKYLHKKRKGQHVGVIT